MLNSDSAADLLMASVLNKEHTLLSSKWYYSTELRVFNTQLIYKLALFISPDNWHTARVISVAIFLIIFIISSLYLCHMLHFKSLGAWFTFTILCPFCSWYGYDVLFFNHYIINISITFVTLALLINICQSIVDKKYYIAYFLLLFLSLLCVLSGLNGLRQFIICYVPLPVATLILLMKSDYIKNMPKPKQPTTVVPKHPEIILLIGSILICFFSGIGYLILNKILINIFYVKNYGSTQFLNFDFDRIIDCIGDIVSLFGWTGNVNVFSISGISNIVGLFICFSFILAIARCIKSNESLPMSHRLVLWFFISVIAIDISFYSFLHEYNVSYWTQSMPILFLTVFIAINNSKIPAYRLINTIAIITGFIILSISTIDHPYATYNSKDKIDSVEWLSKNGYTQGIGSFWNSQVITGLTDGSIEMWTLTGLETGQVYEWLQPTSHSYYWPVNDFFVIMDKDEYSNNFTEKQISLFSAYLAYQDDYYIIYLFNNIQEYLSIVYSEKDLSYLKQVTEWIDSQQISNIFSSLDTCSEIEYLASKDYNYYTINNIDASGISLYNSNSNPSGSSLIILTKEYYNNNLSDETTEYLNQYLVYGDDNYMVFLSEE